MDKIALMEQFWQTATNCWQEWRTRAKNAYLFYRGVQWDADVLEKLRREGRPSLTLNKIKPIIRVLSGWQRQNRQDLKCLARRGGVVSLAEIFTELLKYFYDVSRADYQTSFAFFDGVISGKGWLALDIDYTKDPLNGDLLLKRERPLMIYEDPHAQAYDLSDAKFIIRTQWADREQIEKQFPKAKKDMGLLESTDIAEREPFVGVETIGEIKEYEKYRYLVKEFYWREFKEKRFVIDSRNLEIEEQNDLTEDKAQNLVNTFPHLRVVDTVMPVLNLTTMVGKVILQDIKDPFNGISAFPLIRFCSDWIDGYIKGEVDDLIDPQKELNKRRSQALHLINTEAHSGYYMDEGALSPEEEQKLKTMGSTPGIIIKVRKGMMFKRIEPGVLSQGHITLEKLAEDDLKKISGVNTDLLGYAPEHPESGKAMLIRKQHGLLANESIFDNFQFTQQILGETILEFIRRTDILSDEEIQAIVQERNMNIDLSQLKMRKTGKYQIVLTTMKSTPTQRMADFYMLLDALKMGVPIPMEVLIESSDLPAKEAILDSIKQQKQPPVPGGGGAGVPPPAMPLPAGEGEVEM